MPSFLSGLSGGLSAAGYAAGAIGMENQKAQLEEEKLRLISQLTTQRDIAGEQRKLVNEPLLQRALNPVIADRERDQAAIKYEYDSKKPVSLAASASLADPVTGKIIVTAPDKEKDVPEEQRALYKAQTRMINAQAANLEAGLSGQGKDWEVGGKSAITPALRNQTLALVNKAMSEKVDDFGQKIPPDGNEHTARASLALQLLQLDPTNPAAAADTAFSAPLMTPKQAQMQAAKDYTKADKSYFGGKVAGLSKDDYVKQRSEELLSKAVVDLSEWKKQVGLSGSSSTGVPPAKSQQQMFRGKDGKLYTAAEAEAYSANLNKSTAAPITTPSSDTSWVQNKPTTYEEMQRIKEEEDKKKIRSITNWSSTY